MGEGEDEYISWRRRQRMYEEGVDGSRRIDRSPRRPWRAFDIAWWSAWRFAFNRMQRRQDFWEYFGAAQLAVTKFLRGGPHAPDTWIYQVAIQAVLTCWQRSKTIHIPPTTRARWVKQKKQFQDFERLSYQFVYDASDTIRDAVLREHPHWEPPGYMILEPAELDAECMERSDEFQRLRSLCRDPIDLLILETRWNHGNGLNNGTMIHIEEIAWVTGIELKEVNERLRQLEQRYYAATGQKRKPGPMPRGTRPKNKKAA